MYLLKLKSPDYLCCRFQIVGPTQVAPYYLLDTEFGQNHLARHWACEIMLPSGTMRTKCGEPRTTSQMMVPLPKISYDVSKWPRVLNMFLSG